MCVCLCVLGVELVVKCAVEMTPQVMWVSLHLQVPGGR